MTLVCPYFFLKTCLQALKKGYWRERKRGKEHDKTFRFNTLLQAWFELIAVDVPIRHTRPPAGRNLRILALMTL